MQAEEGLAKETRSSLESEQKSGTASQELKDADKDPSSRLGENTEQEGFGYGFNSWFQKDKLSEVP